MQEEKNESLKHDREVIEVKDFVTDRACGLLEHTILFRKTHIFGHNSNENDKNYFYYVKFEDDWFCSPSLLLLFLSSSSSSSFSLLIGFSTKGR